MSAPDMFNVSVMIRLPLPALSEAELAHLSALVTEYWETPGAIQWIEVASGETR